MGGVDGGCKASTEGVGDSRHVADVIDSGRMTDGEKVSNENESEVKSEMKTDSRRVGERERNPFGFCTHTHNVNIGFACLTYPLSLPGK